MHGLSPDILVHEEVNPKLKVWAVELRRQRRKLALRRDGIPAGFVDGDVVSRTVEVHASDLQVTVGKNDEADVGFTLLGDWRLNLLRQQRFPVALDVCKDAPQVGPEVHSLRIGENISARAERAFRTWAEVTAATRTAAVERLANVISGQVIAHIEVRLGWVLGGRCLRNRRSGDTRWSGRNRQRCRCRWNICRNRRRRRRSCGGFFANHLLQLLEGLIIYWPGRRFGCSLGHVLRQHRHVQLRQFVLFHGVRRIDKLRRVPEYAGTVEDEPRDDEPEEQGYVDRFSEAAAGALVLDGVEQPDELVLFQLAVAIGANTHDRLQRLVL